MSYMLKAFHILYFDLKLGRDVFPIEKCISKFGVSIKTLPHEINVIIWNHYHKPSSKTQRDTILSFLKTFQTDEPFLFRYFIYHMLETLNTNSLQKLQRYSLSVDEFSIYAESIWNSYLRKSIRGTQMTVNLFAFLQQRRVVMWMLQQKIDGAVLLLNDYIDDFQVMKTAFYYSSDPSLFSKASFRLKDNEDFILDIITDCALHNSTIFFRHMSERLREKKDLIIKILTRCSSSRFFVENMEYISLRLRDDQDVITEAVAKDGLALKFASDRLKRNKEIALLAVNCEGTALQYVHEDIRYDRDIVIKAIKSGGGEALEFAGEELQDDREIVELVLDNEGWGFEFVHPRFRDDEMIIRKLVTSEGSNLMYASERLQDDLYIHVTAMEADIRNFYYTSERLRDNHAVALDAVRCDNYYGIFEYVSHRLKDDKTIAIAAVNQYGDSLKSASKRLRDDRDVVMTAIKQRGTSLQYASFRLRDDKEVVMAAIGKKERSLQFASERLRDDKEVVLAAFNAKFSCHFSEYIELLSKVSRRLQSDYDVVKAAVTQYGLNLEFADEKYKDDEEIVAIAVMRSETCIQYASERLKNNKNIIMKIQGRHTLVHIGERLRDDKEVVMGAVARGDELQLASSRLQEDEDLILTKLFN